MADPITIGVAVITGLVGAYKAYTEYKAAVVTAQAEQQAAPTKTEEAAKGEKVATVVETGIQKYGDADERADLANFERNPERYRDGLARVLADVAAREPAFASQLQTVAQQANIQTGGVQGSVNISGQGKVYGTAAGTNTGTISGTYNIGDDDKDETK
jgi:hypothetical protein